MPHNDENQPPSSDELDEPNSSPIRKYQALQKLYIILEAKKENAEAQRDLYRTQLEEAQENIATLKGDHAQYLLKQLQTQKTCEIFREENEHAEKTRDETLEEIAKLREQNGELKKQSGQVCNENANLAMKIYGLALEAQDKDSENEKLKEELEVATKNVKRLELGSEFENKEIVDLRATVDRKLKVIKILENKARDNKRWTDEISEDKEMWANRAEHLEESRKDWIHYAKGLEHENGLLDVRLSIITDDMEQAVFDLDKLDEVIELKAGRMEGKDDDIVEGTVGCYHLTTCKKCIQQNPLFNNQSYILDTHKELIRRLSDEIDEEKAIVRDQNERVLELENFLRERDMQVIELKNEAARKERELRLAEKEQLCGLEQDPSRASMSRSI